MIKTINNFLPANLADEIESIVSHHKFPWYWRPSSAYGISDQGKNSKDYQFIHLIYYEQSPQSELFELMKPLLQYFVDTTNINIKDVYKIKANLLTPQDLSSEDLQETVHGDIDKENYISMVYYISDSDGDTILFDNDGQVLEQVSPKKGSAVYFKSNIKHRATPPRLNKRRMVLNFIFEI